MKIDKVSNYTNGWYLGNFYPTLLKTAGFEVALHHYPKGFKSVPHTHKIATEYNCIVTGRLIVDGHELGEGDIFIYEPNDVSDIVFLEDTKLTIIKTPSVPGDKYEVA